MKKLILLSALNLLFFKNSAAQILCIYCYDQNDSISSGITNLLMNGSFENSDCLPDSAGSTFCPNSVNYSCDIADWNCINGGPSTYACIFDSVETVIPEGDMSVYFGSYFCAACLGSDTNCFVNSGCTVSGVPPGYPVSDDIFAFGNSGLSLLQAVNGLIPGNIYVLEFWAGGESEFGGEFTRPGLFAVDIGFGDTLFRCKPTLPVSGIGTRFIIEFNATSPSHTFKFTNWGHICDSCTELILDDVRLYTLAELSASVPHCTSGIDDDTFAENSISISPNPFHNELNIKTGNEEISEITLYDTASRILLQLKFSKAISLNTEQLAKGIYYYEVRSKNGACKNGKIVKE